MSIALFRSTGNKDDLVRGITDPSYTSRMLSLRALTTATAATYPFYLGYVEREGLAISSFHVVTETAVARHATAYFTFRPFWSLVVNSAAQKRHLGTARSTNSYSLAVGIPMRMHDEEELNLTIPRGALLGVDLVVTSTPSAVNLTFLANLKYGG